MNYSFSYRSPSGTPATVGTGNPEETEEEPADQVIDEEVDQQSLTLPAAPGLPLGHYVQWTLEVFLTRPLKFHFINHFCYISA